ncbi:MAG TPA: hypothetical protein VGJ22_09365 [Anaerolineales bacterium]|jgi:hypothetical protein
MLEVEITIPPHLKPASVPDAVERVCADFGLERVSLGTLASYPGCVHWHYKQGKQGGTLEITWWEPRLWIKVAAGRSADWIMECIPQIKRAIEEFEPRVV